MTPAFLGPPLSAPATHPPILVNTTPESFDQWWYDNTQELVVSL